jgi:2-methylcitrate dehydratase
MLRYEDLNDTYNRVGRVGHFSEVIPTALAVGERVGASGAEVIAAIVIGYEVLASTTYAAEPMGRGAMTFGAIASPAVAGKLLALSEDELVDAIGLSLTCNVVLVSWLGAANSEVPMIKASVFGSTAHHGILAALLAEKGFTGPPEAIERFLEAFPVSDTEFTLPAPGRFTLPAHNMIKAYAAQAFTQGAIEGALRLAREHEIRADDIDEVVVHGFGDLLRHSTGDGTYRPRTRERADHSGPFVVAIALLEGDVLPPQYRRRQWEDPRVLGLMQKIRFVLDDELDRAAREEHSLPVRVEIRAGGATRSVSVDNPRGHERNPMTWTEIEGKFDRVVGPFLDPDRRRAIVECVARLDEEPSLAPLMEALIFQ